MASTPVVSIIICTYNQEGTIARTIEAIVHQESRVPFEVIIGNDCSTDHTAEMCQRYVEKYPNVHLITWSENKGVLDNYYSCVREAKGEYIMECGGDDEWCPGRINLCLDIMEKYPNVVQVYTDVFFREESTGEVRPSGMAYLPEGITKGKDMIRYMFREKAHNMASYAMTRRDKMMELMEEYPSFFTGRKWPCEDKQLKALIGTKGDVYCSPACTYYYAIDTPSITHTRNYHKKYEYCWKMICLNHALAKAVGYNRLGLTNQTIHFLVHMIYWKMKEIGCYL